MRLMSALYDGLYPFNYMWPEADLGVAEVPEDLQEGDRLILWGGGDISPTLYNKRVSTRTYASEKLSKRDQMEWALLERAVELGIPVIGVCRGGQMLTAKAGGYLIQHISGHNSSDHGVVTTDDKRFYVNSIHHQMMIPGTGVDHELIGWAAPKLSDIYIDEDKTFLEGFVENELIYYPTLKGMAIQWHPEGMPVACEASRYLFNLMEERF